MKAFNKNTPLTVVWELTAPDGSPYDVSGLRCIASVTTPLGVCVVPATAINAGGNAITWTIGANILSQAGRYSVRLTLDDPTRQRKVCDLNYNNAFQITPDGNVAQCDGSIHTVLAGSDTDGTPVVKLFSIAEYGMFTKDIPLYAGADGYWYFDGNPVKDNDGNFVQTTHSVEYDPETFLIYVDKGKVNPDGVSQEIVIDAFVNVKQTTEEAKEALAKATEALEGAQQVIDEALYSELVEEVEGESELVNASVAAAKAVNDAEAAIAIAKGLLESVHEAEEALDAHERIRIAAETARTAAETARSQAESARAEAETLRAQAFTDAQTSRQQAFEASQTARTNTFNASEQSRANTFAQTEAAREQATAIIQQEAEKLTELERKVEMPTPLVLDSSSWRIGQTIDSVGGYVDGVTWARHVVFHPIPSGISGLRITGTPTSYWIHQYDENQTWIKRVSATESLVMLADIDSRCRFIRFVAGNPSSSGIAMTQEKANSVSVSWIYDITKVNEELRTIDSEMGDIKAAIGLPYLVEKNKEFAHNAVYTTREPKGGEKIAVRVTTDVPRLFGVIAYVGGQYVTLGTFVDNGWHTYDYPSGSFSLNIQNQSGYTTSADIEVAGYGLVQKVDKITSYDFSSYGEENKDYVTMCLDAVLADISNKHIKLPSWYSEQMTINLIGQRNFVLDGNGATILPINGFVFNRCNDFTIKNCKIDFRNAGSRLECVKVTGNSSNVCITDNIITGAVRDDGTCHGGGIMVMPSESGEISNIRISNNRILDSHPNGILVQCNCSDFHIHNNVVIGGDNIGIEIEGRTGDAFSTVEHRCHSGYISNNIVRNMKDWGILIDFTDNCNVHDNIVENCYSAALVLGSKNINVHHNRFENIANKGIEVSPEYFYPSRLDGSIQGADSYTTNENIIIDSNIVKANPRNEYVRIPTGVIMINYARKVICSNNQIEAIDVNDTTTHNNGISISSSQDVSVIGNQISCGDLLRYGITIANAFMYSCIRYKDASGITQEKRDYLEPDVNYNLRNINISDNIIVGEKGNNNTVGIGHFLTDAPEVLRNAFTTFSEVTIKGNKIIGFFYSLYLPKDSDDGSLVSLRNNEMVNCTTIVASKTKETETPNINTVPVGTSYFDATLNKVYYKSSLNTWIDQNGNIKS